MGKLNIAHHKSYHPYKADNIERVKRDEERAAAIEAGDRAKVMQADSEARIALLRKRSKRGKTKEEDDAEKALERQLKGKGKASESQVESEQESESRANILKPTDTSLDHIITDRGHFNFWADLENGNPAQTPRLKTNADYEAEKKAEQDKWDSQITMYLQAPPKTWYDSSDRLNHKERKMTEDQKLEHAYKDNENKRGEDPLAMMQAYLKRRDEVKNAQEKQRADPWASTPHILTAGKPPVQAALLSRRNPKDRHRRKSPSPLHEIQAGPEKPPDSTKPLSVQEKTATREFSERERAKALLAAKRRENESAASTPRSEFGYQTGMYNRAETRNAKGYSNVRWDAEAEEERRQTANFRPRHRL